MNTSPSENVLSNDESNEGSYEENEESYEENVSSVKKKSIKLPRIPQFPVQHYNHSIKQATNTKSIRSSQLNHDLEASNKEQDCTSSVLRCNTNSYEKDVLNILTRVEGL